MLTVVAVIVGLAFGKVIGREASNLYTRGTDEIPPDIEVLIDASPAEPMYSALKSFFPEDAKLFRNSLVKVMKDSVSEDEAFQKMMTVGADIRRRHASSLRSAPDTSLTAVAEAQLQILKQFESDPRLCNQVFAYGPIAVPKDQQSKLMETAKLSTKILFRAMYEGETLPVQRSAPTDADWSKLMEDFLSSGGTEKELDLISNPDLQDLALCNAGIRFLRVVTFAEFDGADRIRAELMYTINGG
jgi:hypothetical protein